MFEDFGLKSRRLNGQHAITNGVTILLVGLGGRFIPRLMMVAGRLDDGLHGT
jgi:hypothetical protein